MGFLFCEQCGESTYFSVSDDGFNVCCECGFVEPHYSLLVSNPWETSIAWKESQSEETTLLSGDFPLKKGRWWRTSKGSGKGRYKPIFHWNERIAQMCLMDPEIPPKILEGVYNETLTLRYGSPEDFTRADVVMILRSLGRDSFRERWKSILRLLNPHFKMVFPSSEFLEIVEKGYMMIEDRFGDLKHTMPKSVIRKSTGKVIYQERHNSIPFNYLFRKICEAFGVWDFHQELPLLRSPTKLHHLDDIASKLFPMVGYKFTRTPIIKRPKMKKKSV